MAARFGTTVSMKAKPKKWAAESLVSETERKAIASPEQQKMAGEMLLMMSPIVPGGKKLLSSTKKALALQRRIGKMLAVKGKGKAGKVSDKKLLELYNKSHPRTSKPPAKKPTDKELSDLYKKAHPRTRGKKAKGGSVKKYARGGGVRKARF